MTLVNNELYEQVTRALKANGRDDLVEALRRAPRAEKPLTSAQAAKLLGVSSVNTVKNWLEGGAFPGAYQTPGGHWRFLVSEVLDAKHRMLDLADRNRRGELSPWENDADDVPLL